MGQKNKNLKTGINRGEFSEFAFALHLVSKASGLRPDEVYKQMKVVNNRVIFDGPVRFVGDGKMIPPYEEYCHLLKNGGTAVSRKVDDAAARAAHTLEFKSFDEIHCFGAASGKDDVTLLSAGKRVDGISLKWDHMLAERLQSPLWKTIAKSYGSFGVDLTPLAADYAKSAEEFLKPALRLSNKQGDYSPELLERGNQLLDSFEKILLHIAKQVTEKTCDLKMLATRIINTFVGTHDDIHFVELMSCSKKVVLADQAQKVYDFLVSATLDFDFEGSNTGRSRTVTIKANGSKLLEFFLTSSTNGKGKGKDNYNMRTVKPQVYIGVYLPV